jgi:hypothetical protein
VGAGRGLDPKVPVVRYETDDEVALIDPFLPPNNGFDPLSGKYAEFEAAYMNQDFCAALS